MIDADAFLEPARGRGLDFYCGVPCSFLTPIINRVIGDPTLDYVAAASEGEAVAIAAGAWLAGRGTSVMCQNSGLGNAVNPLTSLNFPFRIPTLLITTWRGGPGVQDEPQHELMGEITAELLDVMRVRHRPFPKTDDDVSGALTEALAHMEETGLPYAMVMEKGDVAPGGLDAEAVNAPGPGETLDIEGGATPSRMDALAALLERLPDDAAVIATTGKCGRELFTLHDREQHLYQVGSMGCAAAMGLGVALNTTNPIVVVDGDGALLMKMGTLATVGAYGPGNLIHIVLDNGTYDSTGGQPTVSGGVDFAAAASAVGYRRGVRCQGRDGFVEAIAMALHNTGPTLIHMPVLPGSAKNLGRPTVKPLDVARRFKGFLETHISG